MKKRNRLQDKLYRLGYPMNIVRAAGDRSEAYKQEMKQEYFDRKEKRR